MNKYPPETEIPIEILEVDNSAVRDTQIARLEKLRRERNSEEVKKHCRQLPKVPKQVKETFWNWQLMQPEKELH